MCMFINVHIHKWHLSIRIFLLSHNDHNPRSTETFASFVYYWSIKAAFPFTRAFCSFPVSIRLLVVQKSGEHQLSLEVIIPLVTKVSKTCQVLVSRISGPSTVSEYHLTLPNPLGHQHLLFWHNAWVPVPTPRHFWRRHGSDRKKRSVILLRLEIELKLFINDDFTFLAKL